MINGMNKDKLFETILQHNERNTEAMNNVATAINRINDQNTLHNSSFLEALHANTDSIKQLVAANTAFLSFFRWIVWFLIGTLAVAAGYEKVFKFIIPS